MLLSECVQKFCLFVESASIIEVRTHSGPLSERREALRRLSDQGVLDFVSISGEGVPVVYFWSTQVSRLPCEDLWRPTQELSLHPSPLWHVSPLSTIVRLTRHCFVIVLPSPGQGGLPFYLTVVGPSTLSLSSVFSVWSSTEPSGSDSFRVGGAFRYTLFLTCQIVLFTYSRYFYDAY